MFASGIFLYTSYNFIQQKSQKVSLSLSFSSLMLICINYWVSLIRSGAFAKELKDW